MCKKQLCNQICRYYDYLDNMVVFLQGLWDVILIRTETRFWVLLFSLELVVWWIWGQHQYRTHFQELFDTCLTEDSYNLTWCNILKHWKQIQCSSNLFVVQEFKLHLPVETNYYNIRLNGITCAFIVIQLYRLVILCVFLSKKAIAFVNIKEW